MDKIGANLERHSLSSWRPSRPLKNSVSFADEALIVAVVYVEVPDEAAGGVDDGPSATAGAVSIVAVDLKVAYNSIKLEAGRVRSMRF